MSWSTAPPLVKAVTIAAFLIVAGALGIATYDPAGPHWPLGPIVSFGCALVIACFVLLAGNAITHPLTREVARAATDRRTYHQSNRVPLLQVALMAAIALMAIINFIAVASLGGGWIAGASCATFLAILAYPDIRHRLERGRWPD